MVAPDKLFLVMHAGVPDCASNLLTACLKLLNHADEHELTWMLKSLICPAMPALAQIIMLNLVVHAGVHLTSSVTAAYQIVHVHAPSCTSSP